MTGVLTEEFLILRSFPSPKVEAVWRDLLLRVEFPTHYTAPEFFIEKRFLSRRPFAILSIQRGVATGVLTGIHDVDHTVSGLTVRPQLCLDRAADEHQSVGALMNGLLRESHARGLIEVCSAAPLADAERFGFQLARGEGSVMLGLSQPLDALFKQLDSKRRNNIRFALKSNLEFAEISREWEFVAYYQEVYSRWRDTPRKTVVDPATSFEEFERRLNLNANRKLFVAKMDGKIIAGAFLRFYPGGVVEYSANSSLDEFLRLKPNDFIQWKAIEWAHSQKFKAYSLGGAGKFHRKFGGAVMPAYRYWRDQTFLRKYKLHSKLQGLSRKISRRLPPSIKQTARSILGRIIS
jgi:hypothetical protein